MIKTINLIAGIEMEAELMGGCHVSVENRGTGIIYASKSSGITADSDGVTAIDSGNAKVLRNVAQYRKNDDNKSYDYYGKIYLLSDSDTKAEIQTANDLNFFSRKNSAKGGETYDDTEIKNEIADLQNSKVDKVIGKGLSTNDYTTEEKEKLAALENYDDTMIKSDIANKVDNDIFVAENLIKYPYESEQNKVGRGVTFTYDDDGAIHLVGTGTSTGDAFALVSGLTLSGTYTISVDNADAYIRVLGIDESGGTHLIGSVINGEPTTFTIGSENENIYPSYKVAVRVVLDKVYDSYFKPMLEVGSVAHAYQPYKLSRKAMRDDINALMALLP